MLSLFDLLDAISVIIIFTFGCVFGIWVFIKSRKEKIRLLSVAGVFIFFTGFQWIGGIIDIFTVFLTGHNMDNPFEIHGILVYMWSSITISTALYVSCELLIPKKKWYLISIYFVLSIIYELFLFLDYDNSITSTYTGAGFIMSQPSFGSPAFWILTIFFSSGTFVGFALLIKGIKTKAEIRRKYLILSVFYVYYPISCIIVVNTLIQPKFIPNLLIIIALLLLYYALKPVKPSKSKTKIPSEQERKFASYIMGKSKIVDFGEEINASDVVLKENLLIFMSYATKDVDTFKVHDIAKKLTEFPEIENVLYWEEHMEDNIFEYMDENLDKCDAMILFCSEHARDSVPVKKEWTAAEALGKSIIPIFYNPHHIPALLSSRLGVQFDFYDMERNVKNLRNLILKKVGGLSE